MLGASVTLAGSTGYLPKIGPARVRFQPPPSGARVLLPPLQMPDPLPALAPTPDAASRSAADPGPDAPGTEILYLPAASTNRLNQVSTNAFLPAPDFNGDSSPILSPQMFLRFFTPAGTGAGREVVGALPPGFNPAHPGTPATSSATYTAPKP